MKDTGTSWVEWVGAFSTIAAIASGLLVALVTFWRRPKLSLHVVREHWHLENDPFLRQSYPYIRLVARNAGLRRASHGTRVLVEHYRPVGGARVYLGSPALGWTSALDAEGFSAVIFPAGERPVDLGLLDDSNIQQWIFRLAPGIGIFEGRNVLRAEPNGYIIRVVIGSNDGRARRYDVHLNWEPEKRIDNDEWNTAEALASVQLGLQRV